MIVLSRTKRSSGEMENKMKTTIVHWEYMGVMEKKMETIIKGYTNRKNPGCPHVCSGQRRHRLDINFQKGFRINT